MLRRAPIPALRPFVQTLWASELKDGTSTRAARERVLPTGAMHLVFRLSAAPLRLFDSADAEAARPVGHCIVGGARSTPYVRDISTPSRAVGAMLYPGAANLLFGGSAAELAGQHTRLEDLWGPTAELVRERMLEAKTPAAQLALFEALLLERLPRVRGLHPAVADALAKFETSCDVGSVAEGSGYSHRRFIELFERAVGLTPKRYARVLRFQRVLRTLTSSPRLPLVERALAIGYSDQSHFNREFREMAGISPTHYQATAPRDPHHVPVLHDRVNLRR